MALSSSQSSLIVAEAVSAPMRAPLTVFGQLGLCISPSGQSEWMDVRDRIVHLCQALVLHTVDSQTVLIALCLQLPNNFFVFPVVEPLGVSVKFLVSRTTIPWFS